MNGLFWLEINLFNSFKSPNKLFGQITDCFNCTKCFANIL